jgi:hypothetical protein
MFVPKGHHWKIDDERDYAFGRVYRKSYIVNIEIVRTKIYANIAKYSDFDPPGGLPLFHPLIRTVSLQKPLSRNAFINSKLKMQPSKSPEFTPKNTRFFCVGPSLNAASVARTSKSAVARASKPSYHTPQYLCRFGNRRYGRFGNLRYNPHHAFTLHNCPRFQAFTRSVSARPSAAKRHQGKKNARPIG